MSSWPCSLVCLTRVNALYAHDRLLSPALYILISSCAFQLTVDITLSFLSVMFKSLSSTIPRTPMISSIELPESSSPVMMRPVSRHSSRFAAAFSTSSRSMTPAPNERPRKDSSTPSSSSRTRKTSITGGLKSFLKPRKPSPEPVQQREIAMPRPRKASRTSPVDDIEAAAVGARPPVLAYTQSNSSHQGPSGWRKSSRSLSSVFLLMCL
ncbi:hypothetical protein ARMSODRAFT_512113 [Armillaria solidipes]|uniref:Uncharacterized protein n=1 Tax=Armillaria solidipes TaxID=1076256 RepID=A0A2H3BWK6_9AGAR|nr:hypothetical protein ARMSODRAFT_512113 [Armillaria solidipes]